MQFQTAQAAKFKEIDRLRAARKKERLDEKRKFERKKNELTNQVER